MKFILQPWQLFLLFLQFAKENPTWGFDRIDARPELGISYLATTLMHNNRIVDRCALPWIRLGLSPFLSKPGIDLDRELGVFKQCKLGNRRSKCSSQFFDHTGYCLNWLAALPACPESRAPPWPRLKESVDGRYNPNPTECSPALQEWFPHHASPPALRQKP